MRLSHELTVAARTTYEVGGDGVTEPQNLRRYNELLHGVVSNAWDLLEHRADEVGCWPLIVEVSRDLPSVAVACQRAYAVLGTCKR